MADWEFGNQSRGIVPSIEDRLRARGWASHVTLSGLLATWESLATNINQYDGVIEEYLDDVTNRDALKIVVEELAPEGLRDQLKERLVRADDTFTKNTQPDDAHELRHFFRISDDDEWWWHRIPTTGPLLHEIRPS